MRGKRTMDVAFCPECHKAGLKHLAADNRYENGLTPYEDYEAWVKAGYPTSQPHLARFCPRCKKWVEPAIKNVMVCG